MIELKQVCKAFDRSQAVNHVNLSISKGSIYGLIGSNGAGKTTLIKMIAGIYQTDLGAVTIAGHSVFENINLKQKLFFIPDQPQFLSQYNTKQMARFYQNMYPSWSEERFEKLTKSFELNIHKKIQSFSKGWQRQIAFILALSAKPEIMILDEPMDGLDPVVRKKVKNILIQDVAEREMTILISSHNLREIEDLCDHIGVLHKGKLLLEKEIDELKADVHKIQVAYKGGSVPEQLKTKFDILHSETRGSVQLYIVRGSAGSIELEFEKTNPVIFDILPLTLEEIFIYEMGDIGYAIKNVII
ncbi:ABC transporter ATP-binding protein [Bacillus sp. DNRA2]|uniref:ABC transporter ATP-binding protein n=1 Tax=Bacillus sp. DNRA2 TaxID=2723053 RepID=UPI00145C9F63|nr:ABC transporter ATP-binding protein [Bacillus sp. DNRA2]NMD70439.1 ABC transporter ATP-binding protein [Bacillus sp. DNRA2]